MSELSIAVLASGNGSNMQAIIDEINKGHLKGRINCVISNNSGAFVLQRAIQNNIESFHISARQFADESKYIEKLLTILEFHKINLIVLAGYMKLLPIELVRKYKNRIINIHPALLPKYGGAGMYGLNVHKAVIESGDRISGATVHFVDEEYDHGAILIQRTIPVLPGDTAESLADRVLQVEHIILPQAVRMFEQ